MSRHVSLPVAVALLVAVFLATILVLRTIEKAAGRPGVGAPLSEGPGFEPGADNVSGGFAGRLHVLRNRIASDPSDTAGMLELARLLHDAHQPFEASGYYKKYLEANPDNSEVWYDLAESHGRAGDWMAARGVMQSVLARNPDDGRAVYNLGMIELQLGNAAAARGWLEQAASLADQGIVQRARAALAALERGG